MTFSSVSGHQQRAAPAPDRAVNAEARRGRTLMRMVAVVTVFTLFMLAPPFALAQERSWEWHWGTHPMMFMWGAGGLVMMLMMLAFWGLVIAGLVIGLRWLTGKRGHHHRDEAGEILRQRYARGEINKQEFETRKRDLGL
jgi:putative membrane protein